MHLKAGAYVTIFIGGDNAGNLGAMLNCTVGTRTASTVI